MLSVLCIVADGASADHTTIILATTTMMSLIDVNDGNETLYDERKQSTIIARTLLTVVKRSIMIVFGKWG